MTFTRGIRVGVGAIIAVVCAAGGHLGTAVVTIEESQEQDALGAPGNLAVVDSAGRTESLVLVVGGLYPTERAAESAASASNQGELQGYYVVPTDQLRLTATYVETNPAELERVPDIGSAGQQNLATQDCERCLSKTAQMLTSRGALPVGQWMAVTAFRTLEGAEAYLSFLRHSQQSLPPLIVQAVRLSGSTDIGLGQEADPDGSGPVLDELPDQEERQG